MNKKLITVLFGLVFFISFASALTDNTLSYNEETETIVVKNFFGLGADLEKATLVENMCEDGRFCQAIKEVEIYKEGVLIEDFKTIRLDDGSEEEQNIRWHKFEYWGNITEEELSCNSNETETYTYEGWIEYRAGEILPAGKYLVKTSGEIKPGRVYDWQIKINSKWTTPWAIWGNITEGDEAEVTLLSPADEAVIYVNPSSFDSSINITNGAYLTNVSHCDNSSGSWACGDLQEFNLFDNFDDTTVNTSKWTVVTAQSGPCVYPSTVTEDGTYQKLFIRTNDNTCATGTSSSASASSQSISLFADYDYAKVKFGTISLTETTGASINAYLYLGATTIFHLDTSGTYNNYEAEFLLYRSNSIISYRYYNGATWSSWTNVSGSASSYIKFSLTGSHGGNSGYRAIGNMAIDYVGEYYDEYNYSSEVTINDGSIWNTLACDTDGDCGMAPSNFTVYPDMNAPTISINYPTGLIDYKKTGDSLDLNWTVSDDGTLDTCWFEYGGTNTTVNCTDNHTTFNLTGDTSLTFYANDSFNNIGSETQSWNYKVFENSRTVNSSSFETKTENFAINVTANTSLTAVQLEYNGTLYSATKSGSVWSKSFDIPLNQIGNNSVRWKFTYGGDAFYSDYSYQNVTSLVWTLCNASYTDNFLNISFKDESTLLGINATIQSSTWDYYLGDGLIYKTYTYSTADNYSTYEFCSNVGNETIKVNPYVNYVGDGYPNRAWQPSTQEYIQNVTDQILYLLGSTDGIYVTFITTTSTSNPISGTSIEISRSIGGEDIVIAQGTTDAAGSFTAWLNPNYQHTVTATKVGYTTNTQSIIPTQTTYTIIMSTGLDEYNYVSDFTGLKWYVFPSVGIVNSVASQNYGFNITAESANIVGCKIQLLNNDKTLVMSSAETIASNASICSVQTTFSINTTYPKFKGRLLVDVGNGYQILEEDAYWAYLAINTTGMTVTDWFNGLTSLDLKYFNDNDQHREYTYVLFFFLMVTIICSVLNYAGWDNQSPGSMILLVWLLVLVASVPGFLTLSGLSPYAWLDKYFVAFVYTFFMVGYFTRVMS